MSDAHSRPPRTIDELTAWQAHAGEEILDPDLKIIDAHHHMWDRPPQRYGPLELAAEIRSGHNVRATVFVECSAGYRPDGPEHLKPVGETEYVVSASRGSRGLCAGILGAADLTLGARVRDALEAHIQAGEGRFRGIRQQAQYDPVLGSLARRSPPQHMLRDNEVRAGVRELARLGLTLDVYLYFTQLEDVVDLARAVPEARIALNHAGTPLGVGPYGGKRDEVFATWARGVRAVAECPNVAIKIGGLGMSVCGFGFESLDQPPDSQVLARAWERYIKTCVDAFGVERSMFESNFPVDRQSCSYAALWNAFKRVTREFSPCERHTLFAATAAATYDLIL